MTNEKNLEVRNELERWAAEAGWPWRVISARSGDAYRLYHGDRQLFYCTPAGRGFTSVFVHEAGPSDIASLLAQLRDSFQGEHYRGGIRIRIWPGEAATMAEWNRKRLGL